MNEIEGLIEILESSVNKNGVIPLTNEHLFNIVKMLKNNIELEQERLEQSRDDIWQQIHNS